MSAPAHAVVTVTWHPDIAILRRQLAGLASADLVIVVDNGSDAGEVAVLRDVVGAASNARLLLNERNAGLAAGLNAGARAAIEQAPLCEYLLFLDQDTEPGVGDVARLVAATAQLRAADPRVGLVGPLMVDAASGLSHGVHEIRGWRWSRAYPRQGDAVAMRCASVNGSGMVVPVALFRELGGFDEALFIDHVDSEYSFRAAHAGYSLHTVTAVRFTHRMGQRSLRFWLGAWRVWPHRSPDRHFYLFRNAVLLMRRPYVPAVWKAWAMLKLALTALAHGVADAERGAQLRAMVEGVRAGWRGQGGPRFMAPAPSD